MFLAQFHSLAQCLLSLGEESTLAPMGWKWRNAPPFLLVHRCISEASKLPWLQQVVVVGEGEELMF